MDFLVYAVLSLPNISVYLLYAIGIVVIYRASRVLNLAHGVMAMMPAYVYYWLTLHGTAPGLAALAAVAFGGGLGIATERLVVRRLRPQGPTAQTVGTIAVFGLGVAVTAKIFGTAPTVTVPLFPTISLFGHVLLPTDVISIGPSSGLRLQEVYVLVIGVVVAALLFALFRFTSIGLAMRGAADNRRGAMLMGVDVERTTVMAWALGGALAGLAGVCVGATTNIHPYTLSLQVLPSFVAALLGGLESLPGAVLGAAVVGLISGEIPALTQLGFVRRVPALDKLTSSTGFSDLVLMIVTFAVMIGRGSRLVGSRVRAEVIAGAATIGGQVKRSRYLPVLALVAALVVVVFPFVSIGPPSWKTDATLAAFYLMVALSIVLLTGWVGQISLAQAEFVGVGAFFTSLLASRWGINFPLSFFLATALAALVAAALGAVALRVRGLYLAIATLVFAAMADKFLFNADWFGIVGGAASLDVTGLGNPDTLPYFDLRDTRVVYFLFVAVAAACLYGLANLRESKTGRAFFAVRGSEVAAASLGIDVTWYKLLAFLIAGGIAGAAGNLYMVFLGSVVPDSFSVLRSLFVLSIAVVGGLLSLGGAIAAAVLFAALQEVFFRYQQLSGYLEIVSSSLLLAVLLLYPGGLAALPDGLRRAARALAVRLDKQPGGRRVLAALGGARERSGAAADGVGRALAPVLAAPGRAWQAAGERLLPQRGGPRPQAAPGARNETGSVNGAGASSNGTGSSHNGKAPAWEGFERAHLLGVDDPRPAETVLKVSSATVRFGGLTAVRDVSLELHRGEIVGLIGANGAGKTTLFNVISGLVIPVAGTVEIAGSDVTSMAVHQRARKGLARTFQDIQLFPQLTAFENLLVATHLGNRSRLAQHVTVSPGAVRSEAAARERVRTVLQFLGLEELGPRRIADLSFGLLRLVEIARALVTGAEIVLLDEPASGLDNNETDRLRQLLLYVRENLGVSMLVVEHDVRTVVALSDYMYVLDQGELIGEGRPAEVQRSERVIEAYLGQPVAAG